MPEGHLIRIAADKQTDLLGGRRVRCASPQGRFAEGAAAIDGKTLKRVEGVGKQLFYHFPAGRIVQVHLGRLGYFRYHGDGPPEPTPGVRWRVGGGGTTVDLIAPITCRVITPDDRAEIVTGLGPDPLHPDFDEPAAREVVWQGTSKSRKAIGALMLDQSLWAGVGNIFRAEALLRCGIHPDTPGKTLDREAFDRLWEDNLLLMRRAVKVGKIVGVDRADVDKPPSKLRQDERFLIYKQDACRRCGTEAGLSKAGGREIRFCPRHQPAPP